MSQLNSMAIPMEGKYSESELLELKNKMTPRHWRKEEVRQHCALRQISFSQSLYCFRFYTRSALR